MALKKRGISYKDAGVSIDEADRAVNSIRTMARKTFTAGVLTDIGSFGGGQWLHRTLETYGPGVSLEVRARALGVAGLLMGMGCGVTDHAAPPVVPDSDRRAHCCWAGS